MKKKITSFTLLLAVFLLFGVAVPTLAATTLKAPTNVKVTSDDGKPVITWSKVTNAKSYVVYRKTASDDDWVKVSKTTKTTLTDSKLKAAAGDKVEYMVRAAQTKTGTSLGKKSASVSWTKPADCPYQMTSMPVIDIAIAMDEVSDSKEYSKTTISFYSPDGSFTALDLETGIRIRGNASRGFEKKSFKLKLDKKNNLYGLASGEEKVWVLVANHCDQSLLRNQTALQLQRSLSGSAWGPNCMSVEVYMNGQYQGVYMLAEEIKISENRVSVSEEDPDAVDTGYLIQFTAYADEPYFWVDASYEIVSDLSEDQETAQKQKDYINSYVYDCLEALKNGDEAKAEELMDIDSLVACYLTEEISMNIDAAWDSFYLYKDAGGKLVFGPVWDFDLAFGNDGRISDNADEASYSGFHVANAQGSLNETSSGDWYALAMNNEWFRKMVAEAWKSNSKTIKALPSTVSAYAESGEDAFERNFVRWPIFGQMINQEPYCIRKLDTYSEHAEYLVTWITKRIEWLNNAINSDGFIAGEGIDPVESTDYSRADESSAFYEGDEVYTAFASEYTNVSEMVNIDSISAPEGCRGVEVAENLFDARDSKYCVSDFDRDKGCTVSFEMSEAVKLKAYILYTGNDTEDSPERNPDSWIVYGSSNGKKWIKLDTVADGKSSLQSANYAGTMFEMDKTGKYKYYKFVFQNEDIIQFSELILGK